LSTSASPVDYGSSWKQEVNRRVAEHKKGKSSGAADRELVREHRNDPASRAAQAAARVAARYANAPSYNEMLADEARAAMQAAEAASRAARAAHAAAQSVLDSLEAASQRELEGQRKPEPHAAGMHAEALARAEAAAYEANSGAERSEREGLSYEGEEAGAESGYAIRWEPELPARRPAPVPVQTRSTAGLFDSGVQDWPEEGSGFEEEFGPAEIGFVEPAEPIHGNLIEFPRQLVATRKVRPRRVEGPLAESGEEAQLSIFEVDPGAICIEPDAPQTILEQSAPTWSEPEWCGMRLDAHPEVEEHAQDAVAGSASAPALQLASASRRMLAVLVDVAMVTGVFLALAVLVVSNMAQLPGMRAMEISAGFLLVLAGAAYQTLFFTFTGCTPGMYYAQLRLCTFQDETPTRRQRNARLIALLLSALPMGLGLAWAIFDDDHLSWHDRLSHTYLRRC
jgi:uncharacterized RDD family membrane protein YckC